MKPRSPEVVTANSKIEIGNDAQFSKPRYAIPPKPLDTFNPASINYRAEKNTFKKTVSVVHRVFYVDVAGIQPRDIPDYMDKVKDSLTKTREGSESSAFVENAKSIGVWEDFFIPVRGMLHSTPSLWQRIKWFFVGRPAQTITATRIELLSVEVTV